MSTPIPIPGPPRPDPTTPGMSERPTALGAAFASAATGSPLAVVSVWLLETYGSVHGQPVKLDSTTAAAIGAVGAGVAGYMWSLLSSVLAMVQERLTRP